MVFEQDDKLLMLDCGLMFPDVGMHGIDLVLPDFTYLRENAHRLVGCVATHAHEDHVGALSYLLRELSFPIYGSKLTLGFARHRIEEAGLLSRTELISVKDGERIKIGPFDVEFIPVTHSVPHAFAIALHTPQGIIMHSGDFKLDMTPVDGRLTDLARMGAMSSTEGVRLLLGDSTNAEEHGHAPSETSVGGVLRQIFAEQKGKRIITASFASHIHRIQQIADAAVANGRVVCTLGMSMRKNVRLARELGLFHIADDKLIDIETVGDHKPENLCIISTGSQGEPMSALALMAAGDSKWLKVGENDVIILSSNAIPGNEHNVNAVIDGLLKSGAEVVHSGIADVHATGHAQADDLKMLLSIVRPQCFIPVHGEYRHMYAHARLARLMGVKDANVLQCEDGDVVTISDEGIALSGRVPAGYLYVDGIVGDVGQGVLRDRKVLAEEGVVVVVVTVDMQTGKVLVGPEIITRGWVYAPEAEDLLDEACDTIAKTIESSLAGGLRDVEALEKAVRRSAGKFVSDRTRRRPMIVPVVMEA